jgi:hypothetical protein
MKTMALSPISSTVLIATFEYDSDIAKVKKAKEKSSKQTDQNIFKKYKNLLGKFTQNLK